LKSAIREVLPEAACYMHFPRNALDYVPRKVDDDCLQEQRWFYDRCDIAEVWRDIAKWQAKYPRLCNWVDDNEETLTYYRLPLPHHKHMKSTNMLERLNQELKRRTHVVRIFPMPKAVCGRCGRWPSRCTRTGSKPRAISTWII
jgi:putative transposase